MLNPLSIATFSWRDSILSSKNSSTIPQFMHMMWSWCSWLFSSKTAFPPSKCCLTKIPTSSRSDSTRYIVARLMSSFSSNILLCMSSAERCFTKLVSNIFSIFKRGVVILRPFSFR